MGKADLHGAEAAHGVAHQIYPSFIDIEFLADDVQNVHDILFAQLAQVWRIIGIEKRGGFGFGCRFALR